MWVTQTYLRSPDEDAKLHIYYLFEEYDQNQIQLTKSVQKELASLGREYGRDITLYMPEPDSKDAIRHELRSLESLWWSVHGRLPGLLILTRPLEEYDEHSPESFYIPLFGEQGPIDTPEALARMIRRVTEISDEHLQWEYSNPRPSTEPVKNRDLFDAIELKPGLFGFRVDLKKLLIRRQ